MDNDNASDNNQAAAELLVDAQAKLGEGPLWCPVEQALYWTDIQSSTLSRWRAADGAVRVWPMPERLGSFAFCEQPGRLLLALASGVALFDLERGALLTPIVPVEPENSTTRLNDGRCDPQGRFVVGIYNQTPDEAPIGHFYRIGCTDGALTVERLPLPKIGVANSLAFSPDGTRMYFTDSPTRQIWCVDYHADGRLGEPRPFVKLGTHEGYPDGSTVDADGGLWNAQWRGNCVVRYDADGYETDRLALPASQITCPVLGGAGMDELFVTSARAGVTAAELVSEPAAGGLFRLRVGRRGVAPHRFRSD